MTSGDLFVLLCLGALFFAVFVAPSWFYISGIRKGVEDGVFDYFGNPGLNRGGRIYSVPVDEDEEQAFEPAPKEWLDDAASAVMRLYAVPRKAALAAVQTVSPEGVTTADDFVRKVLRTPNLMA